MGLPPLVTAFHAVIHRNEYALTWLLLELPGIEQALENDLNCGNASLDYAKVRETT
jgi:hypothetical protein